MNVCVLQQVEFILYYPQKVFNLPNVVFSVIFMATVWSFVYITYIKFTEVLLKRVETQHQFWKLFRNSVWHIGCYLSVIFMSGIFLHSYSLGGNVSNQTADYYSEIAFSVICAFLLHRLYLISKTNGLDSSAVRSLIAAGVFSLSYGARCLRIGVRFVIIWSVTALIVEAICLALNVTEILWKKRMGVYLSAGIVSFFCLMWSWLYLYVYPLIVLLPVTSLNITYPPVSLISLLLLALWGEFLLDVCTSPVRSNNHLKKEDSKRSGPKNSQAVMQTIRCVLLLKKKLKRMRDKKNLEHNSSTPSS
ncbi:hypothetical protein J437_LFUL006726 [Ladona fulva]|uniref:Uncharacterized protein n=1 Tax=Ladona fulva TaxID=123851 RepID=A0A8K0JU76_LADFU|nr:hypothetical protein J437_LFUL006726 [Ladona fulva]